MTTRAFRAPNGFPTTSATGRIADRAALYGVDRFEDEDSLQPPDEDTLTCLIDNMFGSVTKALEGTSMESSIESILSSLTYAFNHQVKRAQTALDDNESQLRDAHEQDDRSEISSLRVERLTDRGHVLEQKRDACEHMRDAAAEAFSEQTGSVWRPSSGSKVNHKKMTAASVSSRDYLNAKRYKETNILVPPGVRIAFTGGLDCNDVDGVFATLDKVHAKHPDMVLLHTKAPRGADLIAVKWAKTRNVPEIGFEPDWTRDNRAAPFKRNELLLAQQPIGLVVFDGTGIQDNLATKAREQGIIVFDRRTRNAPQGA